MAGKQKTAAAQKQLRLETALRANLGRRKAQARARADGHRLPPDELSDNAEAQLNEKPNEKPGQPQKPPDESSAKR